MSEIFQDIEGVEVLVDDILVWTETEEQHDKSPQGGIELIKKTQPPAEH